MYGYRMNCKDDDFEFDVEEEPRERQEQRVDSRDSQQPQQPLPIAAGATVPLDKLIARGWSLSEIDTAVAVGVLTRCGGKSAYVTDRVIY